MVPCTADRSSGQPSSLPTLVGARPSRTPHGGGRTTGSCARSLAAGVRDRSRTPLDRGGDGVGRQDETRRTRTGDGDVGTCQLDRHRVDRYRAGQHVRFVAVREDLGEALGTVEGAVGDDDLGDPGARERRGGQ